MSERRYRVLAGSILILLLLLGAASSAVAEDGATHDVQVGDFFFAPPAVEVVTGDTVLWTQTGTRPHTVTADDGSFDSHPNCPPQCMGLGDTFEVTFTEPGEVGYYCKVHGAPGGIGQSGTVIVRDPEPEPLCVGLIAGQHTVAGTVCVTNDGQHLSVTYTTTGEWELSETHLHVADHPGGIPQTSLGSPRPGLFDHSARHGPSVTTHTYTIALSDLAAEVGDVVVIAAQADVRREDGGETRHEGAWGDGEPFSATGSPAMYFAYKVQ